MVKTYGNGVYAPQNHDHFIKFVESLPQYGSDEYQKLLKGVSAFKQAHSGDSYG
jgi:hypothetical protein